MNIKDIIDQITISTILDNAPAVALGLSIVALPIYIIAKKYLDTNYDQFKPAEVTKYIQHCKRVENSNKLPEEKGKDTIF